MRAATVASKRRGALLSFLDSDTYRQIIGPEHGAKLRSKNLQLPPSATIWNFLASNSTSGVLGVPMRVRRVSPLRRPTGAAGKEQLILDNLKVVRAVAVNIRVKIPVHVELDDPVH